MTKKILFLTLIIPLSLLSNSAYIDAIKVAYIYNIAKFITWKIEKESSKFQICSYPNSSIDQTLKTLENKKIKDKVIMINNDIEDNQLKECRILFISKNEHLKLDKILQITQKEKVLTISDYSNYSNQGVIINIYEKSNKLHFKINQEEAKKAEIDISSQLLGMATIVTTDKK